MTNSWQLSKKADSSMSAQTGCSWHGRGDLMHPVKTTKSRRDSIHGTAASVQTKGHRRDLQSVTDILGVFFSVTMMDTHASHNLGRKGFI